MTQRAPNGGRTCLPVINGFAESAATAFSTPTLCADTSPKRTTRRCRRVSMNTGKVPSGSANTSRKNDAMAVEQFDEQVGWLRAEESYGAAWTASYAKGYEGCSRLSVLSVWRQFNSHRAARPR